MAQAIQNTKEDLHMNNFVASHGSSWNGIQQLLSVSQSQFFNAVSYPPSKRTDFNLSVSFLTKRMSTKLCTKFTQRSHVTLYLDKNIEK